MASKVWIHYPLVPLCVKMFNFCTFPCSISTPSVFIIQNVMGHLAFSWQQAPPRFTRYTMFGHGDSRIFLRKKFFFKCQCTNFAIHVNKELHPSHHTACK